MSGYRPARSLAQTFLHSGVADAYRHRAPYPEEIFATLENLITDDPRVVLDLGAGEGALARPLAARVDRVDAVDVSEAMVAAGRERPGGQTDNLRWIVGAAETCELFGPYGLVTAGASLHWMEWGPLMERLDTVMTEHAVLAIVEHGPRNVPWQDELAVVLRRHTRSPDHDPGFSVVNSLESGRHLDVVGRTETAPVRFRQAATDYIEQFHSTSSLARELMHADEAEGFDRAVAEIVAPWAVDGVLDLDIVAELTWGRPR